MQMDLEESKALIADDQPARKLPQRAWVAVGVLVLSVLALAGATLKSGNSASVDSELSALISRAEVECMKESDYCVNDSGVELDACKATVSLSCCVAKAGDDDGKGKCCSDKQYGKADRSRFCNATAVVTEAATSALKCSKAGSGCLMTKCCEDKGHSCFQKNQWWADCKQTCDAGKNDTNSPEEFRAPWACNKLKKCSIGGEGCLNTGCCAEAGKTCYVKNKHWADCKPTCEPGKPDPNTPKKWQSPWDCTTRCSAVGDGCLKTGCCQGANLTCFKKNDTWADCLETCDDKDGWACKGLSMVDIEALLPDK